MAIDMTDNVVSAILSGGASNRAASLMAGDPLPEPTAHKRRGRPATQAPGVKTSVLLSRADADWLASERFHRRLEQDPGMRSSKSAIVNQGLRLLVEALDDGGEVSELSRTGDGTECCKVSIYIPHPLWVRLVGIEEAGWLAGVDYRFLRLSSLVRGGLDLLRGRAAQGPVFTEAI